MKRLFLAALTAALAAMVMAAGAQAQTFNAATQSHPGACSRSTLSVPTAVKDLNANGVLSQYAQMIGVHWKKHHLARAMRRAVVVGRVKRAVITANHGCTTGGLVFSVGPRQLNAGETVGVRLPKKYVGRACKTKSHKGCKRLVVARAVVFPTNCWNVNFGKVRAVIYVRPKVKRKPKPKPAPAPAPVVQVAYPSATATLTCLPPDVNGFLPGTGTLSFTLTNGANATTTASFSVTVTGNTTTGYGPTSFGPLTAGQTVTGSTSVDSSGNTVTMTVTSGGKTILNAVWPSGCPAFQAG